MPDDLVEIGRSVDVVPEDPLSGAAAVLTLRTTYRTTSDWGAKGWDGASESCEDELAHSDGMIGCPAARKKKKRPLADH